MNPLFIPTSLSRFRARRAGVLALFCAGVLRVRCGHIRRLFKSLSRPLSGFSSGFAGFVKSSRPPNFRFASLLRLPTLGYTFVFPLNHCAIARVFSAALRLPPSLPLMSPYGLPSAGYPASARWHVFRFLFSIPPSLASRPPARPRWHWLC